MNKVEEREPVQDCIAVLSAIHFYTVYMNIKIQSIESYVYREMKGSFLLLFILYHHNILLLHLQ
jgi:hypothetical protein